MDLNSYFERQESEPAVLLAKRLGVSPVLISQWRTGGRPVPAERCPAIERETDGLVRCEDLRPDVDWSVLRESATCDCKGIA